MEDLLVSFGAAIVIAGHVHAYERSYPVAFGKPDKRGPVYINTGDGGNREGHAGNYLPGPPPAWSAYRDGSHFGHSRFHFVNDSHAWFEHRSNSDADSSLLEVEDSVWIRNPFADGSQL